MSSRTQQQISTAACCSRRGCRWGQFAQVFVFLALASQTVFAFTIEMNSYKPPVKSSVSKLLRDRRYSSASPSSPSTPPVNNPQQKPSRSTVSSAHRHADAMMTPGTSADAGVASFERRMRAIVFGGAATAKRQAAVATNGAEQQQKLPPNVISISSLEEYKKVVGEEMNKVVAVRFFATYCKACKAVAPHFYHLANKYPDEVIFVDVPVTKSNAVLHQGLQVPSLPYVHIYHPTAGLVEECKLTRPYFPQFKQKLQNYVKGYCELPSGSSMASTEENVNDEGREP